MKFRFNFYQTSTSRGRLRPRCKRILCQTDPVDRAIPPLAIGSQLLWPRSSGICRSDFRALAFSEIGSAQDLFPFYCRRRNMHGTPFTFHPPASSTTSFTPPPMLPPSLPSLPLHPPSLPSLQRLHFTPLLSPVPPPSRPSLHSSLLFLRVF